MAAAQKVQQQQNYLHAMASAAASAAWKMSVPSSSQQSLLQNALWGAPPPPPAAVPYQTPVAGVYYQPQQHNQPMHVPKDTTAATGKTVSESDVSCSTHTYISKKKIKKNILYFQSLKAHSFNSRVMI